MKLYYKSSGYVNAKSDKMAFRFWFLLGAHHAYLKKWTSQVLLWILLFAWLPIVVMPHVEFFQRNLGIFAIGLPALGVLWLVADLILIPYYVKKYNELMFSSRQKNGIGEAVEYKEDTERFGYPITY